MRVLQVHTTYREAGGEDVVVRGEAALLRGAGHHVDTHEVANPTGLGTAAALAASPWNPAAGRRVQRLVDVARPDVAHVHNTWFAMSPSVPAALSGAGLPVVATLHNYRRVCASANLFRDGRTCTDCVGSTPWSGVRHACYRSSRPASAVVAAGIRLNQRFALLDRFVDVFLVLNEFMLELFLRSGLDPARAVVKPNWVPDPGPRATPPSRSRTVVVVGRVEALKGVEVLLSAWRRSQPDLDLVVVGDGADRPRLEALAVPGVRFTGQLTSDEVRTLVLSARALAFPTLQLEGQPLTVLEAMAAGTPVLASRSGGTPELLKAVDSRWLVTPGDARAWGEALNLLGTRSSEELDATGRALRGEYERHHDEKAGLDQLLAAYAWAGA